MKNTTNTTLSNRDFIFLRHFETNGSKFLKFSYYEYVILHTTYTIFMSNNFLILI